MKETERSNSWRKDFPLLNRDNLIYLDNAATAQKPECVLKAEMDFYTKFNANPLRGFYELAMEATDSYEDARRTVQKFLNARFPEEIIFTRNTTESLNLAAYSYGLSSLSKDDEIVVTIMEHHSNLLPWQMAAAKTGATLRFLECEKDGSISRKQLKEVIGERTKIVAVTHVSNVLGTKTPVEEIVKIAHENEAVVILDAAQSVAHMPVDVQKLNVDFLAFSGHKLYGPIGIGVLYGKKELLEKMPPFLTGGEMIQSVHRESAVFAPLPHKFEAGTVNAAGAAGLAAAIRYIDSIGFDAIEKQEQKLTALAMEELKKIPGISVLGSDKPEEHCGILTFTIEGVHPHDVSAILDSDGIAVRAGHHCAQPLFEYLEIPSATRVSLAFYNTEREVHALAESLGNVRRRMGYEQ